MFKLVVLATYAWLLDRLLLEWPDVKMNVVPISSPSTLGHPTHPLC